MKKIISLVLTLSMLLFFLVGCEVNTDTDANCTHIDDNNTGYCDKCNAPMWDCAAGVHIDIGGDGECDKCGAKMNGGNTGGTNGGTNGGGNESGGGNTSGECNSKEDHVDADKNGFCDNCDISVVVVLDVYAINDLHGKLDDTESNIGVDELTTYLNAMRANDDYSILLSSGDMWQGSSESNMTKGFIITEWMNELGFSSMTLGNHEYDWGAEAIIANKNLAQFPLLAINVYDRATNKKVDYCDASVVVECGELKVGIIGAIGNCYSSISSDKVEDVYFKVGGELAALIKKESSRLRDEEGVDFVILSMHDGYSSSVANTEQMFQSSFGSYYEAELSSGGYVDMVFEGHTHQNYVLIDQYGVYHMQNGGENKGICHTEIKINYAADEWSVEDAKFVRSSVYGSYADSPIVDELLEKYAEVIAPAYEVLGTNATYRDSDYIEDIVAMLYLEFGEQVWGSEYNIVLGGGYIKTRSPYDLKSGEIIYSDIYSILPFDNNLVLCTVKGLTLKNRFINPANNYHTYLGEYGESIKNSIDDNATYYVVVDSFTASYAPNNLTIVKDYGSGTYARDLLSDYIKDGGLE